MNTFAMSFDYDCDNCSVRTIFDNVLYFSLTDDLFYVFLENEGPEPRIYNISRIHNLKIVQ